MGRMLAGAVAAAVVMFFVSFIFFGTPLRLIADARTGDAQSAAIQNTLATNLPKTGTYMIPNTSSAEGTVLYGRGPVATIHYNTGGFAVGDMSVMAKGFVHMLVTTVLVGFALLAVAGRVTDFASRAQLVVLMSLAATIFTELGEPIWYHHDWTNALYAAIAYFVTLSAGGLVIARWFLSGVRRV